MLLSGDFTWANAAGGDWNVGANWVGGVAPTVNSNITIGALNTGAHVDFTGTASMASVTVSSHGALVVQGGSLVATNATTIASGGSLQVAGGTYSLGGTGTNQGLVSVTGGVIAIAAAATVAVSSGGAIDVASGQLSAGGSLSLANGASLHVGMAGNVEINGSGVLASAGTDANAFTLVGGGSVLATDHASVSVAAIKANDYSSISVAGDAAFTVSSSLALDGYTVSFNVGDRSTATFLASASVTVNLGSIHHDGGTLVLAGGITGDGNSSFYQGGGRLLVGSNADATGPPVIDVGFLYITNGSVEGSGTFIANTLRLGGTISPGGSGQIGQLTFSSGNELSLTPEATLEFKFEVGATGADRVNVIWTGSGEGQLNLDTAAVTISCLAGFTPALAFAGTTFTLFSQAKFEIQADLYGFPQYGFFGRVESVFGNASSPGLNPLTGPDGSLSVRAEIPHTSATFTFVGPSGGSVDDPANWSGGVLPTFGSNVVIPVGIEAVIHSGVYEVLNTISVLGTLTSQSRQASISLFGAGSTANNLHFDFNNSNGGFLTVESGATLAITGAVSFALTASFVVNGNLQLRPGAELTDSGPGVSAIVINGTLSGTGIFHGNARIAGTLAPGTATEAGELHFTDELILLPGATLVIKLTGATTGDLITGDFDIELNDNAIALKVLSSGISSYTFTFLNTSYLSGNLGTLTATSAANETITATIDLSDGLAGKFSVTATGGSSSGESALSATLRTGLTGLQTILRQFGPYFNLGAINYAAQGATPPDVAVLPSTLDSLFGLNGLLSSAVLPTIIASATNNALAAALIGAGFTVDAIAGGATVNSTVIGDVASGSGLLIQVHYSASLLSNLTVSGSFAGNSFNTASPNLLQGLASSLSLGGAISWTGSLGVALAFGVDAQGFFIAPSSTLILSAAGTGTVSGTGTLGGKSGVSVSGTAGANLTVNLELGASATPYRVSDLDGHLASKLVPLVAGTATVTIGATVGPLALSYTGAYTQTANLAARTQAVALGSTLTGTLQLPGLVTPGGSAASLPVTGTYDTGSNTWTFAASLGNLRIYGLTVTTGTLNVQLTPTALSGSGSLNLQIDFLAFGSAPLSLALQATFDAQALSLAADVSPGALTVRDNQGGALLSIQDTHVLANLSATFGTGTLGGTLTLTAPGGTFGAFAVTNATHPANPGVSVSYDLAAQLLSFSLDTITVTLDHVFTLRVAGVNATYDRSSANTNQVLASVANVALNLTLLAKPASTGPPSGDGPVMLPGQIVPQVTVGSLTLSQHGFSLADTSTSVVLPRVGDFLEFSQATVSFSGFAYDATTGYRGTIGAQGTDAELFPSLSLPRFSIGNVNATYDLAVGRFDVLVASFQVTVGEAFRLFAGTIHLSYDPSATGAQLLATFDGEASSASISHMGHATATGVQLSTNGISFGSFSFGHSGGDDPEATIPGVISFEDPSFSVHQLAFTFGPGGVSTGSATLSSNQVTLLSFSALMDPLGVSGVTGSYDFAGDGGLALAISSLQLNLGGALQLDASNVVLHPSAAIIATLDSATLTSVFDNLGTATLNGVVLTQHGFDLGSFTLGVGAGGQPAGTVSTIGFALAFTDAALAVTNFAFESASGFSGSITLSVGSAALYPGAGPALTSTLTGVSGSYDVAGPVGNLPLSLSVDTLALTLGGVLTVSASHVQLSPGDFTLATIATATLSSSAISGLGSATLHNFELGQTGFTIASATLGVAAGTTSTIGSSFSITDAALVATGLSYNSTASTPFSGTLGLTFSAAALFPAATSLFTTTLANVSASFDLSGPSPTGDLQVSVGTFTLRVGDAFTVVASQVVLTPNSPTIATLTGATLSSSLIVGLPTASLSSLVITQQGFAVADVTLAQGPGATAVIGDVLGLTGTSLSLAGFSYDATASAHPISGTVTLAVTAATLYPASAVLVGTLTGVTGSFDFDHAGALVLSATGLDLKVGQALDLTASNVQLMPGQSTMATLATATVSSPQFPGFGTVVLTDLALTRTGFTLGTFTLGQSGGQTVDFGNVLALTGATFTATALAVSVNGSATTVTGAIGLAATGVSLYPHSTLFTTTVGDFTTTYDFSPGGDGALHIRAGTFTLRIGAALQITAQTIEINPSAATMFTLAAATISSPQFAAFGSGTVSNLAFTQGGFTLGSFTLGQSGGQTVDFGDVLRLTGATLAGTNFAVSYGSSSTTVSGTLGLVATGVSLYPASSLFTTTVANFTTSYDFSPGGDGALHIQAGTFTLQIGQALRLEAANVVINPGSATMFTLATATVSSPQFPGFGTGTATNVAFFQTGFSLGSFSLGQGGGQSVDFGDVLRLNGATFTATQFAVTYSSAATTVTGAIGLSATEVALFPHSTLFTTTVANFTTTYDFSPGGDGALHIHAGTFTLKIGEALQVTASNLEINPSAATMFTIASAVVSSQFSDLGTGTITNLAVKQTGFTLGNFTLGQSGGQTVNFGTVLRLTGVTFTATNFSVAYSASATTVSGDIGLAATGVSLFPASTLFTTTVTAFTTTYDFSPGGDGGLHLHAGTFTLKIGEALQVAASNVEIHPGQATMFTLATATVSSPQFAEFGTGTLSNLAMTQSGFTLGSFTLGQGGGQTVNFGSVLRLTGATFTATNFAVNYGSTTTVTGAIGLAATGVAVFPNSTLFTTVVTGFTTSYDFTPAGNGKLKIHADTFTLRIGEALQVQATAVDINPGLAVMFTLATATVSSPQFPGFGTGTISGLAVRQDGFTLGSFTLGQSGGQTVNFGTVLRLTGATFTATQFAVNYGSTTTVSGNIGLSATGVALFPNATFFTTAVTDFTTTYNFGPGADGALHIHAGTFTLRIGEALQITATNVEINPGQATMFTLATATVSSPQFADFGSVILSNLAVQQTGFTLGSFTLGQSGGQQVNFGAFLRLTGAALTVSNLVVTYGSTTAVNGTIGLAATGLELFPGEAFLQTTVTGLAASYNFGPDANGALSIHVDTLALKLGEALEVDGAQLTLTPGQMVILTIGAATVKSPSLTGTGSVVLTDFIVRQDGFSFGHFSLGQSSSQTVMFGNFLQVTGAQVTVDNFHLTVNGSGTTITGTIGLSATGVTLFPGATAFTVTLTGLVITYDLASSASTGGLAIQVATFALQFSTALKISATNVVITPGQATILTLGTATLTSPDIEGIGASLSNFTLTQTGFSLGSADLAPIPGSEVKFGDILKITGITVGVRNLVYTQGNGVLVGTITVGAQSALFFPGSTTFTASVTNITGGYTIGASGFGAISLSLGGFRLTLGTYLTFTGTGLVLAPGTATVLTVGSIGATVTVGSITIGGTASQFAITQGGGFQALPGFGVSLDLTTDSSAFKWPTWLPIHLTDLGLTWPDINSNPLDFSIHLSASVSSLNGLSFLNVSGSISNLVISLSELAHGNFPIIDIGSAAITVGGNMFGGQVSGSLVLGVVKVDANHHQIAASDTTTPVAQRILYGGLRASLSFAGISGFSIAVGISELGPLSVYVSAGIPILLDPNSGLSITNFYAGVVFNQTLPAVTDPLALRGSDFLPANQLTDAQWVAQLEASVVNQARAPPGSAWNVFSQPMIIEGGVTLFSAYTSTLVFHADLSILFSTDGKFLVSGSLVFGNSLTLKGSIYADFSQVSHGSATILLLVDAPAESPVLTIYGGVLFNYVRNDGTTVTKTNQADTFTIHFTGGVLFSAGGLVNAGITGTVDLAFGSDRFDLKLQGAINLPLLGDALGVAGSFHLTTGSGVAFWGALVIQPNFSALTQLGLTASGTAVLEVNSTTADKSETLSVPGQTGPQTFVLSALSVSVFLSGTVGFSLGGNDWFNLQGTWAMTITPTRLTVLGVGTFNVGPAASPFLVYAYNGFFQIDSSGVAATLGVTQSINFPASLGLSITATWQVTLNTTGHDVTLTLPPGVPPINGQTTVSISGAPPGGGRAGAYLLLVGFGDLVILNSLTMHGTFSFLLSPSVLQLTASATMAVKAGATTVFSFAVSGGIRIDSTGAIAAFSLTLASGFTLPASLGFSLAASFTLELNTTGSTHTLAGVTLEAGKYIRVKGHGTLTVAGFSLVGDFIFTTGFLGGVAILQVGASALLTLKAGETAVLTLNVNGGLTIASAGLATYLDLTAEQPVQSAGSLGYSFSVRAKLEINTTGESRTVNGHKLDAGNYARALLSGTLVANGLTLSGTFTVTAGTLARETTLEIDADATVALKVGTTPVFSLEVDGAMRITSDGIAAYIVLAFTNGPPGSLGFSSTVNSATFSLNTTNTAQTINGRKLGAGPYAQVSLVGAFLVSGVTVNGTFVITAGTFLGEASLEISASVSVTLKADTTALFAFTGSGAMRIATAGLASSIDLLLTTGLPASLGFTVTANASLQLNTTSAVQVIGGKTLAAGPYGQVVLSGSLLVSGMTLTGTFGLRAGTYNGKTDLDVTAVATVALKTGGTTIFTLTVNGVMRLMADGLAASITVTMAGGAPDGLDFVFAHTTTATLLINTTSTAQDFVVPAGRFFVTQTIPRGPYGQFFLKADLTVLGLTLNGSFTFTVSGSGANAVLEVDATGTMDLKAGTTTVLSLGVDGFMRITSDGIAAAIAVTLSGGSPSALGFGFSAMTSGQLSINTTSGVQSLPYTLGNFHGSLQIPPGPYARVSLTANLAVGGMTLVGSFIFTASVQSGLPILNVAATTTVTLQAGSTTIFNLTANGDLRITTAGIAAAIDVAINSGPPGALGFSFNASVSAVLELNTTGASQSFTRVVNGHLVTHNLLAGHYAQFTLTGSLAVAGLTLTGSFTLTAGTLSGVPVLSIQALATLVLQAGGTTILSLNVSGGMQVTSAGLAAYVAVTIGSGVPNGLGFTFDSVNSVMLSLNTSSSAQTLSTGTGTITLAAGPLASVAVSATLSLGPLKLYGTFTLTAAVAGGVAVLELNSAAVVNLYAGSTSVLYFLASGDLRITSSGIAAAISLTLLTNIPSFLGFTLTPNANEKFTLLVNTTGANQNLKSGVTVPRGPYIKVAVQGALSAGGFTLNGQFTLTFSASAIQVEASASLNVLGLSSTVTGFFGIYSDGLILGLGLQVSSFNNSIFTLSGQFTLRLNTTSQTINGITAHAFSIGVDAVHLSLAGLTLSGSLSLGISNGVFRIDVPSGNPLTVSFLNLVTVSVSGFIQTDGQFSLAGAASLTLGDRSVAAVTGVVIMTITGTAANGFHSSTVTGDFYGRLWLFNQDVAYAGGTFRTTPFTYAATLYTTINGHQYTVGTYNFANSYFVLSAYVSFGLGSVGLDLWLNGTVTLVVGKNGVSGYFSVAGSLFGLGTTANFLLDANTGAWQASAAVSGGVSGSLAGFNGGVNFSVSATVASDWHKDSFTVSGSAYINYHGIGLSETISGSGYLNGNFAVDVDFGPISVTVHVNLSDFSIWASHLGGGYAFLDTKGNGVWDSSMARVPVDADGNFSFAIGDPHEWVTNTASGYAFRDTNGNGVWDADSEAYLPLQADGSLPVVISRLLDATVDLAAGGSTAVSVLGTLGDFAVIDPLTGLPTGVLDLDRGHLRATGGNLVNANGSIGAANLGAVDLGGIATGYTGLAGTGQTVFFDANGNGRLDSGEISTTANASGFYTFAANLPAGRSLGLLGAFDTNGNGAIDPGEGSIVVAGAHDRDNGVATALAIRIAGSALAGFSTVASPLTTLQGAMVGLGATAAQANARISVAFNLSAGIDFGTFSPTDPLTSAADRSAVLTATAQLEALLLNAASLISAASHGTISQAAAQELAIAQVARTLLGSDFTPPANSTGQVHPVLDLANVGTVTSFLSSVANSAHVTLSTPALDAVARITTALNLAAQAYAATNTDPTRELSRLNALVEGQLVMDLAALANDGANASALIASYSGSNLMSQLNAVALVSTASPTLDTPGNVTVNAGTAINPITLGIGSTTTPLGELSVQVTSSNRSLLSSSGIRVTFAGDQWTLYLQTIAGQSGQAVITVTVTDGDVATSRSFTLTVVGATVTTPVISTTPATTVTVGQTYSYTFAVNSADPARTFAITATTALPAWLTLTDHGDGTATLEGTPPAELLGPDLSALVALVLQAKDDLGTVIVQSFALVVLAGPNDGLQLLGEALPEVHAGTPFSTTFTASANDPAAQLSFSVTGGLPAWLKLTDHGDGTATLSGTPASTDAGRVVFTVIVTDANGQVAALGVAFAVLAPQGIDALGDLTLAANTARTVGIFLHGTDAGSQLTVTSSNPTLLGLSGLLLGGMGNERTLTLAPALNASGSATLTLTLLENGVVVSTQVFHVTVPPPSVMIQQPTLTNPGTISLPQDSTGSVTVTLDGIDQLAQLTASSSNPALIDPAGLIFSGTGANRTLTFTPTAGLTGSALLTLTLSDAGVVVSVTFQVNVTAVDHAVTLLTRLPSSVVGVGSGSLVIDLGHYFSNVDGTTTFALGRNSDAGLLGARIEGNQLILTPAAARAGLATLEIVASAVGAGTGAISTAMGTIHLAVLPTATLSGPSFIRLANGAIVARFTVTLNAPSNQVVRVGYATASGTAIEGIDYTPAHGFIDLPAGAVATTIDIRLAGTSLEPGFTFTLGLTSTLSDLLASSLAAQVNIPVDRAALISQAQDSATIGFGVVVFFAVPGVGAVDPVNLIVGLHFEGDPRGQTPASGGSFQPGTEVPIIFATSLQSLATPSRMRGYAQP